MGGSQGKRGPTWRDLPKNLDDILYFVKTYKPVNNETSSLRILLHGPIGAGKSSFFNSVESVLRGQICGQAPTDAASSTSFTRKYRTFKIEKSEESYYSFVFTDTMGFEAGAGGIRDEDLKLVLRGHVKEGYEFNPDHPLTEEDFGYNSSPSLADKVHLLVVVIPVDTMDIITDDVWKKLREVRLAARDLEIPEMAILTKVDEACPVAKADVKDVYRSIYLKEQVEKFHLLLGIPENCIFLVKNYVSEMYTNEVMNSQILLALKTMIRYGEDFLNNK